MGSPCFQPERFANESLRGARKTILIVEFTEVKDMGDFQEGNFHFIEIFNKSFLTFHFVFFLPMVK